MSLGVRVELNLKAKLNGPIIRVISMASGTSLCGFKSKIGFYDQLHPPVVICSRKNKYEDYHYCFFLKEYQKEKL